MDVMIRKTLTETCNEISKNAKFIFNEICKLARIHLIVGILSRLFRKRKCEKLYPCYLPSLTNKEVDEMRDENLKSFEAILDELKQFECAPLAMQDVEEAAEKIMAKGWG